MKHRQAFSSFLEASMTAKAAKDKQELYESRQRSKLGPLGHGTRNTGRLLELQQRRAKAPRTLVDMVSCMPGP